MSDREQTHVETDILQPVEEEDNAEQEQDVIVPRDHVLCPEIDEGQQMDAGDFLDITLVALRDRMGKGLAGVGAGQDGGRGGRQEQGSVAGRHIPACPSVRAIQSP